MRCASRGLPSRDSCMGDAASPIVMCSYSGHPFDIAAAERFTDLLHKNVTVRASSMLLKRNNEDAVRHLGACWGRGVRS